MTRYDHNRRANEEEEIVTLEDEHVDLTHALYVVGNEITVGMWWLMGFGGGEGAVCLMFE